MYNLWKCSKIQKLSIPKNRFVFQSLFKSSTLPINSKIRDNNIEVVAVECLVISTENVNIKKGEVNRAIATVVLLSHNEYGNIKIITTEIKSSTVIMNVKKTFGNKYMKNNIYHKATFAIVLAYAIARHKFQSAIIGQRVLIRIQNTLAPRQTYVVLSKVIHQKNMKIEGISIPSVFILC